MERKISIVIPAYNEAESIPELHKRVLINVNNLCKKDLISEYEIWFVNDGSKDETENVIFELCEKDPYTHLISLRKNYGKSIAMNAAFHHVDGALIFTMDADLQDDPDELERFINKIDEGFDLVVGWKKNRLDPLEKRLASKLFNRVTSSLSGVKLHDFDCGFKCLKKEVVSSLEIYGELHRYIPVLAYRNGFAISEIVVKHHKRTFGKSKYGVERYMRGLLDSCTAIFLLKYFDRPMYLFGKIGLAFFALGGGICLYLTIQWFRHFAIGGRPLLILGVLLIVIGIQFIMGGLIGNLIVDLFHKSNYSEYHIKEII